VTVVRTVDAGLTRLVQPAPVIDGSSADEVVHAGAVAWAGLVGDPGLVRRIWPRYLGVAPAVRRWVQVNGGCTFALPSLLADSRGVHVPCVALVLPDDLVVGWRTLRSGAGPRSVVVPRTSVVDVAPDGALSPAADPAWLRIGGPRPLRIAVPGGRPDLVDALQRALVGARGCAPDETHRL
jgi:hypothetical protein